MNKQVKDEINKLLSFINRYLKDNGKRPSKKWISERMGIPISKINEYLGMLGILKKKKEEKINVDPLSVKREIPEEKKDIIDNFIVVIAIKICMGFVGMGAIIMSTYYTKEWFSVFLSPFRSYLSSLIMVVFSVISFELILIYRENKQKIFMSVFIFAFIITTTFSMYSTVDGQYSKRLVVDSDKIDQNISDSQNLFLLSEIEERENLLLNNLENKQNKLSGVQDLMLEYNEQGIEYRRQYYDLWWSLSNQSDDIEEEINNILFNLDSLRQEKEELINTTRQIIPISSIGEEQTLQPTNFYTWIGTIFDVSPDTLQFCISVFPAIFYDLIAPLSIAVVMFLKKNKKVKKTLK